MLILTVLVAIEMITQRDGMCPRPIMDSRKRLPKPEDLDFAPRLNKQGVQWGGDIVIAVCFSNDAKSKILHELKGL